MTDAPLDVDAAPGVTAAPLALYRRYRPDTFADVIGQEHVTDPLQRALVNNRVNHAYLFSGPRGCGKTTSARILARSLNCEQGPTPTPCGECQSCRDLARGGPGSIDVIEIDAASHGGVEDARDLRERAFYAPVSSRYKVYIVDEAHMVTTAGFNALLKLVEEPPPHVKFVFATTEPEKVIGTIRSRTHHYPFRLVPPRVLGGYLGRLCEAEGVSVEPKVLPLVVRAGGGSVRDSLSVLDQLLGGAEATGVSYAQATALLGYTPDALLDEMVDAFAAGDGASVFAAVDKVIEVGQDPRRFAEDLLRRLRDLVVVDAVPDAISTGLVEASDDQAERLRNQAAGLGAGELARAAEVIAAGLTEMRGTTAPRLYLELMCARVLLPGADVDGRGLHARLDRLERRVGMDPAAQQGHTGPAQLRPDLGAAPARDQGSGGGVDRDQPAAASRPGGGAPADQGAPQTGEPSDAGPGGPRPGGSRPGGSRPGGARSGSTRPGGDRPGAASEPARPDDPGAEERGGSDPAGDPAASATPAADDPVEGEGWPTPTSPPIPDAAEQPAPAAAEPAPRPTTTRPGARPGRPGAPAAAPVETPSGGDGSSIGLAVADLRRLWPEVLEDVKRRRRVTWILLSQHAHVMGIDGDTLTLGMDNVGVRDSFTRPGHDDVLGSEDVLRAALRQVLGSDLRVRAIVHEGTPPAETRSARPGRPEATRPEPTGPESPGPEPTRPESPRSEAPPRPVDLEPPPDPEHDPEPPADAAPPARPGGDGAGTPPGRPGGGDGGTPTGRPGSDAGPASDPSSASSPDDRRPPAEPSAPESDQAGPARSQARASIRPTRAGAREGGPDPDADARRDDTDLDESAASHDELLTLHLGAELIGEEHTES